MKAGICCLRNIPSVILATITAVGCLVEVKHAAAISITGNDPVPGTFQVTRHERYYQGADKNFLGNNLKLSGVSHHPKANGSFVWATMISDTFFISSNHYRPTIGDDVKFYRTDALSAATGDNWTGTVSNGFQLGSNDIWLGQLSSPPPQWVYRFPILKRPHANYTSMSNLPTDLYVVGKDHLPNQAPIPAIGGHVIRVGRNRIDSAASHAPQFTFSSNAEFLTDEAVTGDLDSGGPTFLLRPTQGPILAGVHAGPGLDVDISQLSEPIKAALSPYFEKPVIMTDLLGDINYDFVVGINDFGGLSSNYGQGPGKNYNDGDLNLDGYVDLNDWGGMSANSNKNVLPDADFNVDAQVTGLDFESIASHWGQAVSTPGKDGDADSNGVVSRADVLVFDSLWLARVITRPIPPVPLLGDINNNGAVEDFDRFYILNHQGDTGSPYFTGDVTGDGVINSYDYFAVTSPALWHTTVADVTGDGKTDISDFDYVAARLGMSGGRYVGDLNGDGLVSNLDLKVIGYWWRHFYNENGVPQQYSPIPEPATLAMAGLGLVGIVATSRRKA